MDKKNKYSKMLIRNNANNIYIKHKKGLEMSFAWIFSIIVGVVIIFIAIYAASKFINSGEYGVNTKTAQEIANAFNPLQTTVENGKSDSIELIADTTIYTKCNNIGDFGENRISLSEKSGFSKKWSTPGGDIGVKNQYIFAENSIEGKKIYFFTSSIQMPFKTADIMMMYSSPYCFIQAPEAISNELNGLGAENANIEIKNSAGECSNESIKVCFSSYGSECDANVYCDNFECGAGYVKKNNKDFYFVNGMVYGAVFGSYENYDCNAKRIMKRLGYLGNIYSEKAKLVSIKGCNTGLEADMAQLSALANGYSKEQDLIAVNQQANDIEAKNKGLECELY